MSRYRYVMVSGLAALAIGFAAPALLGDVGNVALAAPAQVSSLAVGNLALGRPVFASSVQPGFPVSNAVDGNPATYWAPRQSVVGYPWIYVDLGANHAVRQMSMHWTNQYPRSYGVYVYSPTAGVWYQIGWTNSGNGDDQLSLRSPVTGRYFLLQVANFGIPYGQFQLREWEIFGSQPTPPPMTNLALARPAFASSEVLGRGASTATDGDLSTYWQSAGLPAWIYVDLGRVASVNRLVLRWATGLNAARFAIYGWTGLGWSPMSGLIYGSGGDSSVVVSSFPTQFVLVYAIAGAMPGVGIRELEVYGSAGSTPYAAAGEPWVAQPGAPVPEVVPRGVMPLPMSTGKVAVPDGIRGGVAGGEADGLFGVPSSLPTPQ
jgi:hypothetical protein